MKPKIKCVDVSVHLNRGTFVGFGRWNERNGRIIKRSHTTNSYMHVTPSSFQRVLRVIEQRRQIETASRISSEG
jgi:hypothetical protein